MKLWLVRHAEPLIGKGICYGQLDVGANEEATQRCAAALAAVLPFGLDVYVSGLLRARGLANALLGVRADLHLTVDTRLNEMDFGIWEGIAWNDIPKAVVDEWIRDFAHCRFGNVESATDVLRRVSAALKDMEPRSETVWITHAGVIRAVHYLARYGDRVIQSAEEWPVEAPGFGEWMTISIG